MAQNNRSKSIPKKNNKPAAAKQALKKRKLSSNKSRNNDIREKLDRETASLLKMHSISEPQFQPLFPDNTVVDTIRSVMDVTTILRNL